MIEEQETQLMRMADEDITMDQVVPEVEEEEQVEEQFQMDIIANDGQEAAKTEEVQVEVLEEDYFEGSTQMVDAAMVDAEEEIVQDQTTEQFVVEEESTPSIIEEVQATTTTTPPTTTPVVSPVKESTTPTVTDIVVEAPEEVAEVEKTTIVVDESCTTEEQDKAVEKQIIDAPSSFPSTTASSTTTISTPVKMKEVSTKTASSSIKKTTSLVMKKNMTSIEKIAQIFDSVWKEMEQNGWQTAEGKDTFFCVMPGTQFFNFRPNVNVFDSKEKACWKFLSLASKEKDPKKNIKNDFIWELLWSILEKDFGWYTMGCNAETWYIQPQTKFEEFQPNVTIFQSKRLAALKCMEMEKIVIALGDSVDGYQEISFVPTTTSTSKSKKNKNKSTITSSSSVIEKEEEEEEEEKEKEKEAMTTPLKQTKQTKQTKAASSNRRPPPKSASKTSTTSLKTPSRNTKTTRTITTTSSSNSNSNNSTNTTTKKNKKKPASSSSSSSSSLYVPEFKCTFGLVYKKLEEKGWYHRPGKFEYDYFSPDYTKENAILNGNYFNSVAEFEEYIKDCGLWQQIENELRVEHEEMLEEIRQEAEEKQKKQKKQEKENHLLTPTTSNNSTTKTKLKNKKNTTTATKQNKKNTPILSSKKIINMSTTNSINNNIILSTNNKKKTNKRKNSISSPMVMKKANEMQKTLEEMKKKNSKIPIFKCTMGHVIGKLKERGWTYKPGKFEYDYFKPGITEKNGILNEDYWHSEAELETYMKVSGLWTDIYEELLREHKQKYQYDSEDELEKGQEKEDDDEEEDEDGNEQDADPAAIFSSRTKKQRVALSASSHNSSSHTTSTPITAGTMKKTPLKASVEGLTNDIWANSPSFEFENH